MKRSTSYPLKGSKPINASEVEECHCMGGVFYPETEIEKMKKGVTSPLGGLYNSKGKHSTASPSGNFINVAI
ncbi:hypothetical protein [Vibrio crassostreae]|uniref:hypothetical protein n=1 Tax=Vibrio crassostreae TaxID=246167 RepID=UPI001B30BBAD|nr:hypothetical protein [Vibrio crassostreae]